jgi:hypothetical protein
MEQAHHLCDVMGTTQFTQNEGTLVELSNLSPTRRTVGLHLKLKALGLVEVDEVRSVWHWHFWSAAYESPP